MISKAATEFAATSLTDVTWQVPLQLPHSGEAADDGGHAKRE